MTQNFDAERELIKEVAQLKMELAEIKTDLALEKQKSEGLEKRLENLSSGIGRGLWILGGGFISAFVAWVASGGLSIVK